jgi:CheY-like chemotaxis protein
MTTGRDRARVILVVEAVEETRDGIERLLLADGYGVRTARTVAAASESARRDAPDLILARLDGAPAEVIEAATSIRAGAGLGDEVPVIVFCADCVPEGVEARVGVNVHAAWPDDFDQLRRLIVRLLTDRWRRV